MTSFGLEEMTVDTPMALEATLKSDTVAASGRTARNLTAVLQRAMAETPLNLCRKPRFSLE